jgi:CheY-like chemotaxis protein
MGKKEELRQFVRIPFAEDILINNKIMVRGLDISEGGLYVHSGRSFTPGNTVDVTMNITGKKITVTALIQHCQEGVGMGLKFVGLSDIHMDIIKKYIDQRSAEKPRAEDRPKTILMVEDNEMSRRMYKSKLMVEGFQVFDVGDGIEAVKFLNEEIPDLIILDLQMEKLDGFKLLAMLKESPLWKETPVIIFSAKSTQDVIDRVIGAGADEFLPKMVTSPAKLAEHVKNLLKS